MEARRKSSENSDQMEAACINLGNKYLKYRVHMTQTDDGIVAWADVRTVHAQHAEFRVVGKDIPEAKRRLDDLLRKQKI